MERVSWKDPQTLRDIAYTLLQCVPPGYTITYGTLAKLVGTSPRAIGVFMRTNKDLIVVPCHRVVTTRGGLGGYSRGVKFKLRLLMLEDALRNGKPARLIDSPEKFWKVTESEGYTCCTIDP